MHSILFVTALISFCHCATITTPPRLYDTRIVGGNEANIIQHPYQITLRKKSFLAPENPFTHTCSGSIINENCIITAAHCIIGTVAEQFQVVAGTNYRRGSDGAIVPVQEIKMHENFNPDSFDNDVAILVLGAPLPLNNFTIKAIGLTKDKPHKNARTVISGWGTTTEGGVAANKLQVVRVPLVSNELCNEDYDGLITDSMLCAGERGVGGKDACQGDSGGPLVINGLLAGVVSWGYGCARPQYPGVYANITHLHSWLSENILKLC